MTDSQDHTQPEPRDAQGHDAHALARSDDLRFLRAWEQGALPLIGASVRVRQIRRALAATPPAGVPGA